MAVAAAQPSSRAATPRRRRRAAIRAYPTWFFLPAAIVFGVLFLLPDLRVALLQPDALDAVRLPTFIGLDNFAQFFREPFLVQGLVNTLIYGVVTSGLKVVLGLLLGGAADLARSSARGYLRSVIFFPVLVSTIGVGITFTALMHPTTGRHQRRRSPLFGIKGPGWLTDPQLALFSVAFVDVWKGVGLATVIYIAGIVSIPQDYYEAATIDGATGWQNFWHITLPLVRPGDRHGHHPAA